jgi:hypothetical protein
MWGIDVDCHKTGTVEGAKKAAEMLDYYLPGIHTEASTHGKGVHGYVVIDYQDHGPEDTKRIKEVYVNFIKTLDRKAKQIGIDIELIEPKGLPVNVIRAPNGSLNVTDSKQGVLIKAPRNIESAVKTCIYTIEQLEELTAEIAATIPEETKEGSKTGSGNSGAGSNAMFSQDEFDRVIPLARQLHYANNLKHVVLASRVKIAVEDIAAFLLSLIFCKEHPRKEHANGALPCTRLRKLWAFMQEAGIICRAYDPKRIAFIRNLLADYQFLEFRSATYAPGKAMCWGITDEFHALLIEVVIKTATQEEQVLALPVKIKGIRPVSLWTYRPTTHDYAHLSDLGLVSSMELVTAA